MPGSESRRGFVGCYKKGLCLPIPIAGSGIRLIDLIVRRFDLMFLPTGVTDVTTQTREGENMRQTTCILRTTAGSHAVVA